MLLGTLVAAGRAAGVSILESTCHPCKRRRKWPATRAFGYPMLSSGAAGEQLAPEPLATVRLGPLVRSVIDDPLDAFKEHGHQLLRATSLPIGLVRTQCHVVRGAAYIGDDAFVVAGRRDRGGRIAFSFSIFSDGAAERIIARRRLRRRARQRAPDAAAIAPCVQDAGPRSASTINCRKAGILGPGLVA